MCDIRIKTREAMTDLDKLKNLNPLKGKEREELNDKIEDKYILEVTKNSSTAYVETVRLILNETKDERKSK